MRIRKYFIKHERGERKMKNRITLIAIIIIGCVLILSGCFWNELTGSQEVDAEETSNGNTQSNDSTDSTANENEGAIELGDYEVWLGGEVSEQDNKFVIDGQSNLLPGSRLIGQVIVNDDEVYSDTTEIVQEDGSFSLELAHHEYGEATIVIKLDFDTVQDDAVKRHYGERGQKLEGAFIYKHNVWGDIYNMAKVEINYDPNETFATQQIQAPEWYELPDDYGDPRVWIEIVELTDDKRYFYIHGKSNLLEGSRIVGSYGWNRDETLINPDGSFDLRLDYEYLEDRPFVIEFRPSLFQWNIIEEAYGKSGQKLVGNLVKSDSNYQYIELEYYHEDK